MKKKHGLLIISFAIISFILMFSFFSFQEKLRYEELFQMMGALDEENLKAAILSLKTQDARLERLGKGRMERYGYHSTNNIDEIMITALPWSIYTTLALSSFCFIVQKIQKKKNENQISSLQDMIRRMEKGDYHYTISEENQFSKLEDDIYKTLILLRETRSIALKERMDFKESLEDISHQLKTPLTSVGLLLELLEEKDIPREDKIETLNRIEVQVDKLKDFTEILLTLSKLDTGNIEMKQERFLLEECVEYAWDQLAERRKSSPVELEVQSSSLWLEGDFYWLSESFLNILSNALDCYPKVKHITVHGNETPIYREICIEDDGEGVPSEEIPYLFERFHCGDLKKKSGFGIGLPLSKSIIEKNNGEIKVEQKQNRGLLFIIRFYPVTRLSSSKDILITKDDRRKYDGNTKDGTFI